MMMTTHIYALRDPRDGRVFYVGKSFAPLRRLRNHISQIKAARTYNIGFAKWLESLLSNGFKPMLHFLEVCHEFEWKQREKYWIAEYKRLGHPLLNVSPGGFGKPMGVGHPCPDWWRVEFGNRHRGEKKSEEHKRKIRDSNIKTWSDPKLRERLSAIKSESTKRWWAGMSEEKRKHLSKSYSERNKRTGQGFASMTFEQHSRIGKIGGRANAAANTAEHFREMQRRSVIAKQRNKGINASV